MNLEPEKSFTITTQLSPEEVKERLSQAIKPYKDVELSPISFIRNTKNIFGGNIEGDRFNIHRLQFTRNSGHPLLKGKISPNGDGTQVNVEVFLNMGRKAAYLILSILALIAIAAIYAFAPDIELATTYAIMLVISVLIAMLLIKVDDNSNKRMAEKELKKILT